MDITPQTPEFRTDDPLRGLFDRAMLLLVRRGEIDAQFQAANSAEQYPRYTAGGRESHTFSLSRELIVSESLEASRLELYYADEFIDEEGQLNERGQLLAVLEYEAGYAKDIWLNLQPDGSVKSSVWIEHTISAEKPTLSDDIPESVRRDIQDALCEGDNDRLQAIINDDIELEKYAEKIMFIAGPLAASELDPHEFEELQEALRQIETAL